MQSSKTAQRPKLINITVQVIMRELLSSTVVLYSEMLYIKQVLPLCITKKRNLLKSISAIAIEKKNARCKARGFRCAMGRIKVERKCRESRSMV